MTIMPILPTISDADRSLGVKTNGFTIYYTVIDMDSINVNVTEYLDDVLLRSYTPVLDETNAISVSNNTVSNLAAGTHTIKIEAKDTSKASEKSVRIYTFDITNSAPIISGEDTDIGDKPMPFSFSYTVSDENEDIVTVKELLDSKIINSYTVELGKEYTFVISQDEFKKIALGQHIAKIEASDGKSKSSRYFTFRKTGTAPIISGSDKNLLGKSTPFSVTYLVADEEGGAIEVIEKLDNNIIRKYDAISGDENILNVSKVLFKNLSTEESHTITIKATDNTGLSSVRTYTFQKVDKFIRLRYAFPKETKEMVSKILLVPLWKLVQGINVQIKACNNAFDIEPAWEDITNEVRRREYYNFVNTDKIAEKAGINIEIYIDKGTAASISECVLKKFVIIYE